MRTMEVIILAQGTQRRMGPGIDYKQLLPLPACGGVPIMLRTCRQIDARGWASSPMVAGGPTIQSKTIITWAPVMRRLQQDVVAQHVELKDPGNSSLKGIHRYLQMRDKLIYTVTPDKTVVLLGDVIYSWACLDAIWRMAMDWGFVGTGNLSSSDGELWGVAWSRDNEPFMMRQIADAILMHPPVDDDYQPGQLRRWIKGFSRGELAGHIHGLRRKGHYTDIDDYTRDIDIAPQLSLIPAISIDAAKDDESHGISWGSR